MYLLYNLLVLFVMLIYSPVILYKKIRGKYEKNLRERLGFIDQKKLKSIKEKKTIWVHAVSVGETVAAEPIVSGLKKRNPGCKIVFSTVTETGQQMAKKIIKPDVLIYLPFDFLPLIHKTVKKINPEVTVIMETELWPNFIDQLNKQGSKVMLANGRLSDRSSKRYRYLGRFFQDMIGKINFLSMQSVEDKQKMIDLGARENKVVNWGNTKLDKQYEGDNQKKKKKIKQDLKIKSNEIVLVVGSTHPDEEKQLLTVFQSLKARYDELVMVLAPRHIERTEKIQKIYHQAGIPTIKKTKIKNRQQEPVILLNTIGELGDVYSIAHLAFVGGSLVEKGGHNILEPVIQGRPVFFGPHMFNFRDNVRLVLNYGVGIQVENSTDLLDKFKYYLANPGELSSMADKTCQMIADNSGTAEKNIQQIEKMLVK